MTSKKKIMGTMALAFMLSVGVAAAQTTNTGVDQTGTMNDQTGQTTRETGQTGQTGTTGTGTGGTGTLPGTPNTGTATGTTGIPGTPNTGVGGDAAENMLLLGSSALAAIAGAVYLFSRRSLVR